MKELIRSRIRKSHSDFASDVSSKSPLSYLLDSNIKRELIETMSAFLRQISSNWLFGNEKKFSIK